MSNQINPGGFSRANGGPIFFVQGGNVNSKLLLHTIETFMTFQNQFVLFWLPTNRVASWLERPFSRVAGATGGTAIAPDRPGTYRLHYGDICASKHNPVCSVEILSLEMWKWTTIFVSFTVCLCGVLHLLRGRRGGRCSLKFLQNMSWYIFMWLASPGQPAT